MRSRRSGSTIGGVLTSRRGGRGGGSGARSRLSTAARRPASGEPSRPGTPTVTVGQPWPSPDKSGGGSSADSRGARRGSRVAPDGQWERLWESRETCHDIINDTGASSSPPGTGKIYRLDGDPLKPTLPRVRARSR
jgi:hypothetical protein